MYNINYLFVFFRVNKKVVKVKECKQSVLRLRLPRVHALLECHPKNILMGTWRRTCLNHLQHQKMQEIKIKLIEMTTGTEIVSCIDSLRALNF